MILLFVPAGFVRSKDHRERRGERQRRRSLDKRWNRLRGFRTSSRIGRWRQI